MKDQIKETISRWSLDRVQFLLSHIEDFIDDESQELRERARTFVAEGGLDKIERLVDAAPNDSQLPKRVMERLCAFFDAGLLIQRGLSAENGSWWVTDLFWRGNAFHLELADQVRANQLVTELTPLQVHKAPAMRILETVNMQFLAPAADAEGYLLKPTPTVAYVLLSRLPAPWAVDHMAHAHRLVNACFVY